MDNSFTSTTDSIFREQVVGSRRLSNYWWATILFFGALCFFTVGLSSYLGFNILPFLNADEIVFFPQGLVMCFYGILAFLLSLYLWLIIFWSIGEGYNEFNKAEGTMSIFRWGFPGKQRRIDLSFPIQDIEGILIRQQTGIGEQRILCARLRGRREIPLLGLNTLESQTKIEGWGAELAAFLNVPLITS